MTDLKFMASDGNMYPAEWFAQWQSYNDHAPPQSDCDFLFDLKSNKETSFWRLRPADPESLKPKKIYDKYLDEDGDFRFDCDLILRSQVIENPDNAKLLVAFIQDNLPKE